VHTPHTRSAVAGVVGASGDRVSNARSRCCSNASSQTGSDTHRPGTRTRALQAQVVELNGLHATAPGFPVCVRSLQAGSVKRSDAQARPCETSTTTANSGASAR
jgi:hypothetical protein